MAVDGSLIFDTKINTKGFQKGRRGIINSLDGIKLAVLKLGATLGAVFGAKQLINFGKSCVTAAREAGDAFLGLKSIIEGQGRDFSKAQEFIKEYISDGLVPMSNAVTAYKNLASRGYDDSQIQSVMLALKDSATYGRQASLTLGYAIQSATEGLKNENSILVDNAGVTKNVSVMWKDYATSIGTTYTNLTKQQKIQAEVNGILTETRFQTGDASRMADSFSGQLSRLTTNFTKFKIAVGDVLINAIKPIVASLDEAIQSMTKFVTTFSKVLGLKSYSNSASETDTKKSETSYEDSGLVSDASQVTDEIADSVDNQNELTEAVEETAKAEERSLAGFDEINKISDETEIESQPETVNNTDIIPPQTVEVEPVLSGSVEVTADVTPFENAMKSAIERIKLLLNKLLKPVKIAWEDNSPQLIESIQSAFEKIKELAKSVGQSFADIWTNGTGEQYISNIIILFTDVFNIIGDIAGALKEAWNDNGTGDALIQSYFDRWNALLELIHTIADDFREVWNDGTGVEICKNIFEIITNINETVANLRERFKLAWEENNTGKRIIQGILNIFKTILKTINDITSDTKEWSEKLDFSPLLTSIQGLLKSLEPLTENIGSGLEWFYKNVLLPLASWTIEDVIPAFLDLLSGALSTLNSAIEVLKPLAKWLWDSFLEPIAEWTGGIIVLVIKGLANALKEISDWISEHQEGVTNFLKFAGIFTAILAISKIVQTAVVAFTAMGGILGLVTGAATLLAPVISALSGVISLLINPITLVIAIGLLLIAHWDEVKEAAINAWDNITIKFQSAVDSIKEIFGNIGEWFSERWNDIKEVFSVVGEWFKIIFSFAWEQIKSAWSDVKNWFSLLWTGIKEVFSVVADWFKSKFSNAWDNIKKAWSNVTAWFSDIWDSIKIVFSIVGEWFKSRFKTAWDNITSIFSGIGEWFSNRWKDISSAFSDVGNWFRDKFQNAWNNITSIFSGAGKWFSERWNDIASIFSGVDCWFSDKFRSAYNGITDIFSDIGGFFSGIWENISDGAKSGVNWVIDTINGLVDAAESAVNFIIDCINSLSFDIPDFVPSIGGTHVGFDIPWVNIPDIPHLATGTVVPANYGEFLAVLGDNKKEREFVAPESALKNALAEAMAQMNGIRNDIVVNVSMFPNERAFQQYIIKAEKNIQARGGRI